MNNAFNHWTELKTAWLVAEMGTLSAAAQKLGVHRATVLRHVDALEAAVGTKLFQRHAKGYEPTEAGVELMKVAASVDEQLNNWLGTIRRQSMEFTGELIITGLEVIAPFLAPAINAFKAEHPRVLIRYLASGELFKLQYGTAHIAFRTGPKPQEPDYVVQPFCQLPIGLYAHQEYIHLHGFPELPQDSAKHTFVGPESENTPVPFLRWLQANVPRENVSIRSASQKVMSDAITAGLGIGFLLRYEAEKHSELKEVLPPQTQWQVPIWMLTHADLHRSAKVQAFMACLKNKDNQSAVFRNISKLSE